VSREGGLTGRRLEDAFMLNFLKRATAPRTRGGPSPARTSLEAYLTAAPAQVDTPRYPPADPGLPVVSAAAVMASQRDLVERLRATCGFDDAGFRTHVLAPVEAVARHVLLLPASSHEHFAGPGGLFRLCLEMALFCRQAAQSRMVEPMAPAEVRRAAEPRWRHGCLLAGLLCEIPRTLSSLAVTDEAGREWPACLGGLDAWLERVQADRCHVVWREGTDPVGAETAGVLGDLVPKATLAWLNEAAPSVVPSVFRTALGQASPDGDELARVVLATRARVLAVDSVTRRSRYGRLRIGHHLELHLVDALRHRVATQQWACGQAPLWFGLDGLFIEWPAAADAVRHDVIRNGVRGVPLSAFTLAEVLGQAGFLEASAPGLWFWRIHPGAEAERTAVKVADPRALLGHVDAPRLGRHLARPAEVDAPATVPAPSSAAPGEPPAADLASDEAALADVWRRCLEGGRTDLIGWLPGQRLALSQELLSLSGHDVAAAAAVLERRRWLGRGDWPSPTARAGLLVFDGAVKPGLVLNDAGVAQLGLAPRAA